MTAFEERVYAAVRAIPPGRVATYGDVALRAGYPGGARAVGNALHRNPDPEGTPCFRVVSGRGRLSRSFAFGGAAAQAARLTADGIPVACGFVDLRRFRVDDCWTCGDGVQDGQG